MFTCTYYMQEVSLAHLFIPVYQQLQDSDLAITLAQYSGHLSEFQASLLQKLGTSYNEVLDCPLPNPSGPSFPWAWFRDHHNTRDVLVHYHPLSMDNYEFFVGPNVSTLYKQSYRVRGIMTSLLHHPTYPDQPVFYLICLYVALITFFVIKAHCCVEGSFFFHGN